MTIQGVLDNTDVLAPSKYGDEEKLRWISAIEKRIIDDVVNQFEGKDDYENWSEYTLETDLNTELIVKPPYDELYSLYVVSQIDFYNGEIGKYNNSSALFNAMYNDFKNSYNRTHKRDKTYYFRKI